MGATKKQTILTCVVEVGAVIGRMLAVLGDSAASAAVATAVLGAVDVTADI